MDADTLPELNVLRTGLDALRAELRAQSAAHQTQTMALVVQLEVLRRELAERDEVILARRSELDALAKQMEAALLTIALNKMPEEGSASFCEQKEAKKLL